MHMQPTAIVFDLDNTLYKYLPADVAGNEAIYYYFQEKLKISTRASKNAWSMAKEVTKKMNAGQAAQHSRLIYAQHALRFLGYEGHPTLALEIEEIYWSNFLANMEIFPDVQETLTFLRFNRLPLALVTDLTSQIQLRKLLQLRIEREFDVMVTSEMVGCEKVDLRPFRFALEGLPLESKRHVWFVGDSLTDVNCSTLLAEEGLIESGHGILLAGFKRQPRVDSSISYISKFSDLIGLYQPLKKPRAAGD